ncbi:MAG: hypothetical protein IJ125_07270, partial [Atopobiaceae bacterium]|nr:hypothetical protein [Atopobiaceae bacterium]
ADLGFAEIDFGIDLHLTIRNFAGLSCDFLNHSIQFSRFAALVFLEPLFLTPQPAREITILTGLLCYKKYFVSP